MHPQNYLFLAIMKQLSFKILLGTLGILFALPLAAQVSHGGHPLPLAALRSATADAQLFETLPSFDLSEQLRLDSLEQTDLRNGFHFAYKFMTDYTPDNSGVRFTTADGTKVWRLGIYSPGALSLNVLFSEYELPEGAQLFLYNADQSQVLGAFNHLNNSELGLLPVAPIDGDRLIIEYQEPAAAAFPGKLCVGEINHGYRSLRGLEPNDNTDDNSTSPAVVCYQDSDAQLEQLRRSVVLLIVDGIYGCTAVLLNNTAKDGRPYLLTASHCLNKQFKIENPDYEEIAGKIICFYQYESPFCGTIVRGTEELSTASAHYRAVDEAGDMALLELLEAPPVYYQPYYAGCSIQEQGDGSFIGLHHPNYTVKRFCQTDQVEPTTFSISSVKFYEQAHWHVAKWQIGFTNSGSSGSPLFNAQGEVIGALTGGNSSKDKPVDDYYYRLSATWETKAEPEHQLSYWLNPQADGQQACAGWDPYEAAPAYRLSNVAASGHQEEAKAAFYEEGGEAPLFGQNPLGMEAFAEAYQANGTATLHGIYLVTSPCGSASTDMEVEITVYAGQPTPSTILYKERFKPTYTNLSVTNKQFQESAKPLNRSQETFVPFSQPVTVSGAFYVGYQLTQAADSTYFSAYSLPKGVSSQNSAWVKRANGWQPATEAQGIGYSTSLFIDPVLQYGGSVKNEEIAVERDLPLISQGAVKGVYHVWLPNGQTSATYQLTAANGQVLEEGALQGTTSTLRLRATTKGVYLLTVRCGQQARTLKLLL